jgi:predicted HNH restriction endonuclease
VELLDLAYIHRQRGPRGLEIVRLKKQEQQRQLRADIDSVFDEEPCEEGKALTRTSKVAERDPTLRAAAIRIHGLKCAVCGFDFEAV